jgi:catechol-2,3-dioxygenase
MIPVQRLNHAVLYVRDAARSAAFYQEAFGFEVVAEQRGAAFLRAGGSSNHHDLGLFSVGPDAPGPEQGRVGLYHLAWQVPSIDDLGPARDTLLQLAAYTGESDHGATKSIYGKDPDGNEFEIMWMLPRDEWGEHERTATVAPLDLDREVERFGSRS